MPEPKSTFDATYPCDFYEPAELFESDQMYTIRRSPGCCRS